LTTLRWYTEWILRSQEIRRDQPAGANRRVLVIRSDQNESHGIRPDAWELRQALLPEAEEGHRPLELDLVLRSGLPKVAAEFLLKARLVVDLDLPLGDVGEEAVDEVGNCHGTGPGRIVARRVVARRRLLKNYSNRRFAVHGRRPSAAARSAVFVRTLRKFEL
jgi:hypothetical protein